MMKKFRNLFGVALAVMLIMTGCTFSLPFEDGLGELIIVYDGASSTVSIQNRGIDNTEYASIRYTLDGSEPSEKSTLYSSPFPVERGTVVKAKFFTYFPEYSVSGTFTITAGEKSSDGPVMKMEMESDGSWTVSFSFEKGDSVYYTLNGTDPSVPSDDRFIYSDPLNLKDTSGLRFCSFSGGSLSPVHSIPSAPVSEKVYGDAETTVTLKAAEGALIYYTTDGSDPAPGKISYNGPFTVDSSVLVKAYAVVDGYRSTTSFHEITVPPMAPEITIEDTEGGALVSIEAEKGTIVRYTTNDMTSVSEGLFYSGAFTSPQGTLVKAIAIRDGLESAVAEAAVPIDAPLYSLEYGIDNICTVTLESTASASISYRIGADENWNRYFKPFRVDDSEIVTVRAEIRDISSPEAEFTVSPAHEPDRPMIRSEFTDEACIMVLESSPWSKIWYTLDGTEPVPDFSELYEGPVSVEPGVSVSAVASMGAYESPINSDNIPVPLPKVDLRPGNGTTIVSMKARYGSDIYYRVGVSPAEDITEKDNLYIGEFKVENTGYITAKCFKNGQWSNSVSYYFKNSAVPESPEITYETHGDKSLVTITTVESDSEIFYTIDGTDPGEGFHYVYSSPFYVNNGTKINAKASRNGVLSEGYATKSIPLRDPVISVVQSHPESRVSIEADSFASIKYLVSEEKLSSVTVEDLTEVWSGDRMIENLRYVYAVSEWKGIVSGITETFIDIPALPPTPVINVTQSESWSSVEIEVPEKCSVYYTIDGSTPDSGSKLYTGKFVARNGSIIKAVSNAGGYDSLVAEKALAPKKPIAEGRLTPDGKCTVSFKSEPGSEVLYYVGFGSFDTATHYDGPVAGVMVGKTVHAVASVNGVHSEPMELDIISLPEPFIKVNRYSQYDHTVNLEMSTGYSGGSIYYTTDESVPDVNSKRYDGRIIALKTPCTITAVVLKNGIYSTAVTRSYR